MLQRSIIIGIAEVLLLLASYNLRSGLVFRRGKQRKMQLKVLTIVFWASGLQISLGSVN